MYLRLRSRSLVNTYRNNQLRYTVSLRMNDSTSRRRSRNRRMKIIRHSTIQSLEHLEEQLQEHLSYLIRPIYRIHKQQLELRQHRSSMRDNKKTSQRSLVRRLRGRGRRQKKKRFVGSRKIWRRRSLPRNPLNLIT